MKANSTIPGRIVLIITAIVIAVICVSVYIAQMSNVVYFNPAKQSVAQNLYNKIISLNLDTDYPKAPDEVMEFAMDINRLIYSDMIAEEELYENAIRQLRGVYGDELIQKNTFESQLETVLLAVKMLKEQNISQQEYEILPVIYNSINNSICYIRVTQTYTNGEIFYWEYHLERVPPKDIWKIIRFQMTDENFEQL